MNTKDSHKEMYDLIEKFGTAVTDMFEQMIKGNWTDDHDHDVQNNSAMRALTPLINEAISLRAKIAEAQATGLKTVTIKGFVHKDKYSDGFEIHTYDMSQFGDLVVGPVEFEYEIPADFNPVVAEVAGLKKKLDSINKAHTDQVCVIERRINDLLCIENKPSQSSDDIDLPF